MTNVLRVNDASTRTEIEAAIAELRAKQRRMPAAWVDRREEISEAIDELVDQWMAAR